ncbi:riboflavin synthase subunit alpha [Niastella yeongjuensis]|uniref:Riboflavin synthase n=1 Tax=Niastella yeongjuensis TaxID=354355 RepID=A0A1V9F760_9BACT|nr:riboflavin synthase [Niastella yeongjuensis]OQP54239.1 riboflavin synthase subunit alpha [Niastella yeongjuensis]SEP31483.1 riboflavin synthase alpha chain [Niastella yeongjuensis]
MFTGIIETIGQVEEVIVTGTNKTFWISSPLSHELKVDQSISHNGVCLTVEALQDSRHRVTAIAETLQKSNIGHWQKGDIVNLERCMIMNGRLDGHIVQGHVDTTATCIERKALDGSWEFRFRFPDQFSSLIIEKGSISLNGISLTIFNVSVNEFTVAIIPYTFEHTNIQNIQSGTTVNLEFDMVGKYVNRIHQVNKTTV